MRKFVFLVGFCLLLLTVLPPLLTGAVAADPFYVIDGDTFSLNGRTYRL